MKIALDVLPYREFAFENSACTLVNRVSDYSGILIHAKTALPLFYIKNSALSLLAADSYIISNHKIVIYIKKNLYWSNGERIVAQDYVRAVKFICRDYKNIHKTLFTELVNYEEFSRGSSNEIGVYSIRDNQIVFEMKYNNPFFGFYLTNIAVSPIHHSDVTLCPGPYQIDFISKDKYCLSRNIYFDYKLPFNAINYIEYILAENGTDIELFNNNKIDVTSDTSLKFNQFANMKCRDDFFQDNDKYQLIMLVSAGSLFEDISPGIKKIILSAINQDEICATLDNCPKAINSFMYKYGVCYKLRSPENLSSLENNVYISISYEDYYPNKLIVELIAKQLKKYKIILVPHVDEYMSRKSKTHLRLEIRTSMMETPFLFYKSDLFRGLLKGRQFELARAAYSYIIQNEITPKTKEALLVLDRIVISELLAVPLLVLPKAKFVKHNIVIDSIFSVGEPIYHV